MPEVGGEGVRVWVISSWLNTVGLLYVIHMGSHICRKLGGGSQSLGHFIIVKHRKVTIRDTYGQSHMPEVGVRESQFG